MTSSNAHQMMIQAASSRSPSCVVAMDAIPSSRLRAVNELGTV